MNPSVVANVSRVPAHESLLNPHALEFRPRPNIEIQSNANAYSDGHALYLTFSNGFPLTESQISNFFNMQYAQMVAEVYVHKPRNRGKASLFGKVVFLHEDIPKLVMGNHDKVCLCVEGRALYCRRFVTKKTNTANAAATTASTSHHGGDDN
ncbi:unnamed protein product [Cochlearia groenlandica]